MKKITWVFFFLFFSISFSYAQDANNNNSLFRIIEINDAENLRIAVSKEENIEIRNLKGETPLFMAARLASPEMVGILLAASADIHALADDGLTPLHAVFITPYDAIFSGKGIRFDQRLKTIELLLNVHGDVNIRDSMGRTPLMVFVMIYSRVQGYREEKSLLLNTLLSAGADINAKDAYSFTPLLSALMGPNEDIALMLLEAGADIHERSAALPPPLHLAASYGLAGAASFLLRHGALVDEKFDGVTALHLATGLGLFSIEKEKDREPLQEILQRTGVSTHNLLDVTKLLIKYGADATLKSKEKKTVLDYAQNLGNREVALYLKSLKKESIKNGAVNPVSERKSSESPMQLGIPLIEPL